MTTKKNKNTLNKNINAELGGLRLYGTTSMKKLKGMKCLGDIENAGQLDKGFKRNKNHDGEVADFIVDKLPTKKNEEGGFVLDNVDDEDTESTLASEATGKRKSK